ncbi:MAG TPA: type II toxin-antitoxin system VapB family antitoxin [Terracidiphilus sp.]|jgi:antitoxin VapB|nr:type II toxin-antitoxin system VapB family antitoxin [Terracidiphilus sp.]
MNIKNPETEQLARELASRTGESLTLAITVALKERLERQQERSPKPSDRLQKLIELSARTAPLMNDGRTTKELFDELYDDETGLPK